MELSVQTLMQNKLLQNVWQDDYQQKKVKQEPKKVCMQCDITAS